MSAHIKLIMHILYSVHVSGKPHTSDPGTYIPVMLTEEPDITLVRSFTDELYSTKNKRKVQRRHEGILLFGIYYSHMHYK